jgi:hypothetical protein
VSVADGCTMVTENIEDFPIPELELPAIQGGLVMIDLHSGKFNDLSHKTRAEISGLGSARKNCLRRIQTGS